VVFKIRILSLVILVFASCQEDLTKRNQELIIGEWYPIDNPPFGDAEDEIYWGTENFNMTGYEFREDGICENKLGYFEYQNSNGDILAYPCKNIDPNAKRKKHWLNNIVRCYGNYSSYKIENDKLKIYDLSLKTWTIHTISFLTKDTLVLLCEDNLKQEKYIRKTYHIDDKPLLDWIIFYYPNAHYSNTSFFSVHRSGDFICSGCFGYQNEVFTGKIKSGEFERLESMFKKIDLFKIIEDVGDLRAANIPHGFVLSRLAAFPPPIYDSYATFVLNNKCYTIEDPFTYIPFHQKEFMWAYLRGLFLPEQVSFVSETLSKQDRLFSEFDDYLWLSIEKQDSVLDLYHTERFYLCVLLSQAKVTEETFTPVYNLKKSLSAKEKIETDGRYFSYIKDGKKITLDIGFNFIRRNNFDKQFRVMSQFEWDQLPDIDK